LACSTSIRVQPVCGFAPRVTGPPPPSP
jgi:hypothetical protein